MKSWVKYLLIFLGVFALIFVVALPFFLGRGFGMMGFGMRHFGYRMPMMMMGRGFGLFSGLFSLFRLLVWLAIIALIVWAVISFLRRGRAPVQPVAPAAVVETRTCAHCGRPLQAGWVACPYCGTPVTPPEPPAPPEPGAGI